MVNSTRASRKRHHQTAKPHPDFPLTAHPSGRWCKKIRGKLHYFGTIENHQAALEKWLEQKDDLLAGRVPREKSTGDDALILGDLCNRYLTHKQQLVDNRELSPRTFVEYHSTCARLVSSFGRDRLVSDLCPEDFEKLRAEIAKQWGHVRLGNEIQRVRSVFKYADESGLIEKKVRFGPTFKRPSLKTMRKARAEKGPRMFTAAELQRILGPAEGQLRAMILLAVNVGFGNEDCGTLRLDGLDLAGAWVSHPRPKTGINRRAKLWPETVKALRAAIADRKTPKDEADAQLVFVTKYGGSWAKDSYGTAITHEMDKLLNELKLKRPGMSFYTLRHVHRTIADGSRDTKACNFIMGHVDVTMAGHYIEGIEDARLVAVANHVHAWLWPKKEIKEEREGQKDG